MPRLPTVKPPDSPTKLNKNICQKTEVYIMLHKLNFTPSREAHTDIDSPCTFAPVILPPLANVLTGTVYRYLKRSTFIYLGSFLFSYDTMSFFFPIYVF
jgi:hypothetical protein